MVRSLYLTAALVIGAVAFSGAAAEPSGGEGATNGDPNQVVCRRSNVTGSRAQTRRTCKTRAEWIKAENHLRSEWNEAIKLGNQIPPKGGT